jgi:hypothetical protein
VPCPWGSSAIRRAASQGIASVGCIGAAAYDGPKPLPEQAESGASAARLRTDPDLLRLAETVPLKPKSDRAVFYAEDSGARLAADFVAANPEFMRLDELIPQTFLGAILWARLVWVGRPWSEREEVWWTLSRRLAQAASGTVNVFGPSRLVEDRPLAEFKHAYTVIVAGRARPAYANTVFEKVELPELEQNEAVTAIYYNGQRFDAAG